MFQCYRPYRINFNQCLPKECRQRNSPTCTQQRYASSLAAPELPLRNALFHYHPAHSIRPALRNGTAVDRLSQVENLNELLYCLGKILPEQPNKSFAIRPKLIKSATAALEDCFKKRSKHAHKLRGFNAIVQRFHRIQMNVPSAMMLHGLQAAACANCPAAMEQYVAIIGPRTRRPLFREKISLKQWETIVMHILVAARSMPPRSWKTLYQKRAWAKIVTGWDMENAGRGKRQHSLYHALIQFGIKGLAIYFNLVKKFCRAEDIVQIWVIHQLSDKGEAEHHPETLNFIFNSFIQVLLEKNDPQRAWKVVQTTAPRFGPVQDRTWKLLLQHPGHIESWVSGMDKPIFDALERYLFDIERRLGVRWMGGEDGFHVGKERNLRTQ